MKKKKKIKKMHKTHKTLLQFIIKSIKKYINMKTKLIKMLCILALYIVTLTATSCNVTRTITNESQYYQKGDTSVVIQTKTIETYNAEKK